MQVDNLPDPGLVAAGKGDCRECFCGGLHVPHARARVPALPGSAVHLHEAVRAVPQQEVKHRPHIVHAGRRTEGELSESDRHSRLANIRSGVRIGAAQAIGQEGQKTEE